ncbi:hypothetical protein Tco_0590834 [Tanacetum coccineum]
MVVVMTSCLVLVKSDSWTHAHTQALKVKHSASRLLYSKLNKEAFSGEIVSLRSILWEIVSLDEEEEVVRFQDKYEYVGQKHKMLKKVKSR